MNGIGEHRVYDLGVWRVEHCPVSGQWAATRYWQDAKAKVAGYLISNWRFCRSKAEAVKLVKELNAEMVHVQ